MPSSLKPPKPHPARKMWLRPTLKDVAQHAGVARSTVSAILANRASCYASKETRERVFAAARELNYQPNTLSRALLGQQTYTLGMVLRGLFGPTLKVENIAVIEQLAERQGYRMLLASHQGRPELEANLIRSFLAQHVDGVILETAWSDDNQPLIQQMIEEGMPLVMVDPSQAASCAQVSVDRQAGAHLQVRHLLEIGRRKFMFIIESADHPFGQAKKRGYCQALAEARISPEQQIWLTPQTDLSTPLADYPKLAQRLTQQVLAQGGRFDAVATSSDSLALGAMRALLKAGLSVPQDVAIVGFHDEMFSCSLPISMSTIRHPPDVDRLIFDLLMQQLSHGGGDGATRHSNIVRTPVLIRRESTGFGDPE